MFNLVGSNPHHKETDKIMTDKIFNLLDQINREGIDNGTWGVAGVRLQRHSKTLHSTDF